MVEPYAKGARVTHKDKRWTSDLDGNLTHSLTPLSDAHD